MRGMAFGITPDDVLAVASRRSVSLSEAQSEQWFEKIDADQVEQSALWGHTMEEQTDYAHAEIDRQLDLLGCWEAVPPRRRPLSSL